MKKPYWQRGWFIYGGFVLAFIGIGVWQTNGEVFCVIVEKFSDNGWWAENILSLVIFTVLGGSLVYFVQEYRDRAAREKYSNWSLTIKGLVTADGLDPYKDEKPQDIYWEDVRRFQASPFEEWKFIKSAVSNVCIIKTHGRDNAYKKWYWKNETDFQQTGLPFRSYVIDFSKMEPARDITKWNSEFLPHGYEWVDEPDVDGEMKKKQVLQKIEM